MKNSDELADADMIPVAAQRMWTSAKTLDGREFCFIMNLTGRQDTAGYDTYLSRCHSPST